MQASTELTHQQAADAVLASLRSGTASGGLASSDLEVLYTLAWNEMRVGRHDRASSLFGLLTLTHPAEERFMHGLGQAHRGAGRDDAAGMAFLFLSMLHPGRAQYALDLAECLLRLRKPDGAIQVLKRLLARVDADPQDGDPPVAQRARALLELLSMKKGHTDATAQ